MKKIDIEIFLEEDSYKEDVTTQSITKFLGEDPPLEFELMAKSEGTFSGKRWLQEFEKKGFIKWKNIIEEGHPFSNRTVLAVGIGKASNVLATERTMLNGLQMLCGVATQTSRHVSKVKEVAKSKSMPAPAVLHTRKMQPGIRDYIADALNAGGAGRHRLTLADRLLFKDNHRTVLKTEENLKKYLSQLSPEQLQNGLFEADSEALLQIYVDHKVKHVMLDNFTPEQLTKLLPKIPKNLIIELSGGIRYEKLHEYVLPGVHRLSIGALTHGARNMDISLEAKN
jgi:nicotinate-nucleotide pyrophosphorylase (carboxylating)